MTWTTPAHVSGGLASSAQFNEETVDNIQFLYDVGPAVAFVVPAGNLDTTSATDAAWSGTASLTVPTGMTTANVLTTVTGVYATGGGGSSGVSLRCVIGATTGRTAAATITANRSSISWVDSIAVSGGVTTIEVYCRRSSGTDTIRADTSSDFGFLVWFS